MGQKKMIIFHFLTVFISDVLAQRRSNEDVELFKEILAEPETSSLATQMSRLVSQEHYKVYFKLVDANRNRKVEAEELRDFYTQLAQNVFAPDEQLEKHLHDLDDFFSDRSIKAKQLYQFKGFINRLHVAYALATSIDS